MEKRLNTDKDAAPLYIQIQKDIKKKIIEGLWQPGDKIPSELELCKMYDVSRITIREAINELVWEEYLIRHRAKGTFVLDFQTKKSDRDYYTYVKSFTYEMNELGKNAVTLDAEVNIIKADKFLSEQLNIEAGSSVISLNRVRGLENKTPVFFKTYWQYKKMYSLDSADYYGSFYEEMKKHGIVLTNVKEYLEAIKPNKEIQNKLNIGQDTPVLKRVKNAKNKKGNFIEYTECYYVGDSYRYYIDLTNRY